ncbi:MAG: hypothetical protein ACR2H5_09175 [Ktedonobacteraceae bacterium]
MREPPRISEEHLRVCLQDQYDLSPVTLEFLPLGHDYNAGIYRAVSEQGTPYALKVTSRPLYAPRCLVPHYLNEQGITFVVAPIPSRSGALWIQLEDWTVIVYPWIAGDTSLTGMTDEQWLSLEGFLGKGIGEGECHSERRAESPCGPTRDSSRRSA